MASGVDFAAAMLLIGVFTTAGAAFAIVARTGGYRPTFQRLDHERGLPMLGKAPMETFYALALPLGRGLAALGVSANAVTIGSAAIATAAGVLFAAGHFGLGAVAATLASLADGLDGIIARETGTACRFGQILDTTVDRYVEALLVGGIAFFARVDPALFVIALAALVGGFMVSYASSVLRELGIEDRNAPMRRAHRLTYLVVGAVLVPFVQTALPTGNMQVQLAPVMLAFAAIAVVGNLSAMSRLLGAAPPPPARAARIGRPAGSARTRP